MGCSLFSPHSSKRKDLRSTGLFIPTLTYCTYTLGNVILAAFHFKRQAKYLANCQSYSTGFTYYRYDVGGGGCTSMAMWKKFALLCSGIFFY